MNIKEILLNEAGIRIPKGTKAAKIITHRDLDGLFSAIATYHQLVKQGIDPKNIKVRGIQYGDATPIVKQKLGKSKGQMVALVDFARLPEGVDKPDFWTDHHIAPEGAKGSGGGAIGKTEYPSDTEHIATVHAQGIMDGSTVKVISRVDSAKYTNLKDILFLRKDFKEKDRMERLAIVTQALLATAGIYSSDSFMERIVKSTNPSLVSVYNKVLGLVRLKEVQREAIDELSKKSPDWDKVNRARKVMETPEMKKEIKTPKGKVAARDRFKQMEEGALEDYEEYMELKNKKNLTDEEKERLKKLQQQPFERMRKTREGSVEKQRKTGDVLKTVYKGTKREEERRKPGPSGMKPKGSVMHQSTARAQRYMWTQFHQEGKRYPFTIRSIGPMLQVAINPDLPKEVKEQIDLNKVMREVLDEVKDEVGREKGWAFSIVEKESGGHKGITNISGLHLLGLIPDKQKREDLKAIEKLEARFKAFKTLGTKNLPPKRKEEVELIKKLLKQKGTSETERSVLQKELNKLDPQMKNLMPKTYERLQELKSIKEVSRQEQQKIMSSMVEKFQNKLDAMAKKFKPLEGDDPKFKLDPADIKESILERI